MQKRVLIITYYWPPSGGSGVQRWLKFAKYLPESGWDPVIFTPENPDFDLQDESLENEIPANLEVIKFPIWEPYQLFSKVKKSKTHPGRLLEQKDRGFLEKAAIWMRANLLVPDPRIFWVRPAVKFLADLAKSGQFQAVITTGPPHSMHLIGLGLKRKSGLPWIADFRDPWTQWEFLDALPMSSLVKKRHQKLEQEVLREASAVMTISPTFQQDLEKLAHRKIKLLTNGYDPADLPVGFSPRQKKENELHLVYSGVIDSIRNPIPLLKALKEEFTGTGEKVKLTFVGNVSESVREYVRENEWLASRVEFPGYVSHSEVFGYYAAADVLVLILTNTKNAQGNIPGKLFEYLAAGVPVLALGDPQGDSAKILTEAGGGEVIRHEDFVKIQIALRKLMDGDGESKSDAKIDRFSRRALAHDLAEILDEHSLS
ncbi:glycosyltransferase family 4 protein [Algoriphagus aestuariicola]|jgi:glycosyltransferase involved in cell wall biosynthesis|uniref:Glycosyltransferase family 4 protein n=1 Tax=Algoriphagus aestuariicola TaxID=1852016 RepID=A0ABS3BK59_9BACT|nr:glycosyltransferase family 4 protein [Algoriphagus aestuariicola]MBN7799336.1 glycosyltransferase family 4 protein [Algoriphagus aestuariicola]